MRAKKWIFCALLLWTTQACYTFPPAFAQEDPETTEISATITSFLKAFYSKNIEAAMEAISTNYHNTDQDQEIDYTSFKVLSERYIVKILRNYKNLSVSEFEILKSDIQDDKATLVFQYNLNELNLKTNENNILKKTRFVVLAKEKNVWKIIQFKPCEKDDSSFE